jgi:hypothetical protein
LFWTAAIGTHDVLANPGSGRALMDVRNLAVPDFLINKNDVSKVPGGDVTLGTDGDTRMAFVPYVPPSTLAPEDRVADPDNIIQIHAIHPAVMRQHYELYKQLMHRPGPLTRRERELLGVRVSALNHCNY